MTLNIELPHSDELEITTLGPGPSSRESIVVHLKNGEWIIIDSCKFGGKVLPLEYLHCLGVNCKEQVKTVICTHWHRDHIQGLPEILNECENARFCIAPVGDFKGYLNVVIKLAGYDPLGSNIWNTFNECLEALEKHNKQRPHLVGHNERLAHDGTKDIFAIGPSDEMYGRFLTSLLKVDPKKPQEKDIEEMKSNLCSLALSINFNGQKAIIGGDMEVGRKTQDKYQLCEDGCPQHKECGWCDAIADGNVFADEKPYHFINLPHHSSSSAYCPKMWLEGMVEGEPIATTTIFRVAKGENLPTKEMLTLYKKKCKELYITDSEDVEEIATVNDLGGIKGIEVLDEITEKAGIIVSRWRSQESHWKVRCFGCARLVDDSYLDKYHV